ncbi:hypothetical protein ISN45_Aa07g014030 [Arabidopsis thaliana x Arabidopsis arenosa]|uniref:Uncharacterized protein n=1 Tax=Arabidopsis thaliana x Arabidopsis arenosa TaxID=1240361 RepID=A0A8T1YBI1_9BRAS|nr:hypothetical protein ISN45_Aa07g014030 [Arabidopsis thaliana x Arabidopsis arenosa]
MKTYDDDLEATRKNMWWRLYELADVATKVCDEEQRKKKGKSRIVSEEEEEDERFRFLEYVPRKIRNRKRPQRRSSSSGKFKKTKVTSLPRMARETPEWLVRVMIKMKKAEDPRLVFERTLTPSDVNSNQSRLLIPFNMLTRNDFLTPSESQAMEREDIEEENIGVGTILVNEKSKMWGLSFKIWVMEKKNGTLNYAVGVGSRTGGSGPTKDCT